MNRWLPVLLALLLFPAASLAHSEKEHADALCAGFDAIELRKSVALLQSIHAFAYLVYLVALPSYLVRA